MRISCEADPDPDLDPDLPLMWSGPAGSGGSTDPVEVAGVPVLSLRLQVVADSGGLPHSHEGYSHEEGGYIVGLQQPLVHLRQVVEEGQQWRQQRHYVCRSALFPLVLPTFVNQPLL